MKYKIYNQDVIEWAKEYQKGKFHALISDAPYHLTSIVKRFGKKDSAPAQFGTDGVFSRASKGFMGQEWDGGDVAFRPETWEAICEHLYPGAFGMVFSASRNWHRLAVAIEDAGMIIHPTIFGWLNGQGFPKATNISKQELKQGKQDSMWEGHRYGLQALKPAVEPIIVFQKPYEGRPLDNIVGTGAGAINIDGGRIPLNGDSYTINTFDDGAKPWGDGAGHRFTSRKVESLSGGAYSKSSKRSSLAGDTRTEKGKGMFAEGKNVGTEFVEPSGRWPANFILSEDMAERLDSVNGIHPATKSPSEAVASGNVFTWKRSQGNLPMDDGGVSRYFYNVQEQIDEADPIYYCSKVSPKERNAGLDDMPEHSHATNWSSIQDNRPHTKEGYVYEGKSIRNPHPTLKPIALAKYLATLLLPPEGYAPRRILVPFSGVGSEMIGCALAGWEHIVGIEFMEEYVDIAHKRIEYWKDKK